MTLFHHRAEERRKFCRSICTAVRKTRRGKYMRPMDARSRKNGCPVRCHKALKTMGSRLMPRFTPRQQKSIFIRGGIDVGQGLTSTCGGLGTEQYGSWKLGVYFIPRKNVYITDARNQQSVR